MEELAINIREKSQYETFSAYLEDIKKSVEKQNSEIMKAIMKKDSEIAELRAKVTTLEAEKANMEKSESDANLFETVSSVLSKVTESDSKTDAVISRMEELIRKQGIIEEECKNIFDKISELDNTQNSQYDVTKQQELEDIAKDIYAVVVDLKRDSKKPFNEEEEKEEEQQQEVTSDLGIFGNQETVNAVDEVPTIGPSIPIEEAPVNEPQQLTPEEVKNDLDNIVMPAPTPYPAEISAQKVVAEEAAAPEVTEAAKESIGLDATKTKAVRAGVNYLHDKKDQEQPFNMDSMTLNNAELPTELNESFNGLEPTGRIK